MVTQQGELGHGVVFERGLFPILFVMAAFALLAFLTFMLVILLMARDTGGLQFVFIQVALMASRALHRRTMFSQQLKFGLLIVIEQYFLPVAFDVATLALRTEITFVNFVVVFFVASDTASLQLIFIQITFMAAHALHRLMFAQQRIFGLFGVIKQYLFPVAFDVTSLALDTEIAFVNLVVVLLVARHASHQQFIFIQITLMTAHAFQWCAMLAQ